MSGNRKVSPENKLKAVQEYLAGQGSIQTIAAKYGVTKTPFRHWISTVIEGISIHQETLRQNLIKRV